MSSINFSILPEKLWVNQFVSFNGDKKNGGGDKRLVQYRQRRKY